MSQKDKSFQSKGKKFGGKKFGDRPAGRSKFGERSERDRGDRPARSFDRDSRPPRREFGDRPFKKREFGDRPRRESSEGGARPPRREFGDRPRRSFGEGDSRPPRRESGDRPFKKPYEKRERSFGGDREGGFKKPYEKRERSFGGDRDGGFKKPFKKSFDRDDRREGGFKKPYEKRERSFGGDREGGFKKPYEKRERSFGGDRDGGFKKPFKKDFKRRDDRFEDRPAREERFAPREDVGRKLKSDRPSYGSPSALYLYGVHAVSQALLNPARKHKRLLATESGFESLQEAWAEAQEAGLNLPEVITVEKEDIERLLPRDAVHQDILLDCEQLEETFLVDILLKAGDNAKVLILDQVTDPHNIGAILRSAAAFGALAVIIQKIHAPEITGVLAKTASGAVEVMPLIRETNLSRSLEQLKEAGFFCLGLDERGKRTITEANTTGKIALVLGAEGAGLRRLVSENCDELVQLPTQAPIASLNVSNAAAVALYEAVRK